MEGEWGVAVAVVAVVVVVVVVGAVASLLIASEVIGSTVSQLDFVCMRTVRWTRLRRYRPRPRTRWQTRWQNPEKEGSDLLCVPITRVNLLCVRPALLCCAAVLWGYL